MAVRLLGGIVPAYLLASSPQCVSLRALSRPATWQWVPPRSWLVLPVFSDPGIAALSIRSHIRCSSLGRASVKIIRVSVSCLPQAFCYVMYLCLK